jgi:hypothetical protein
MFVNWTFMNWLTYMSIWDLIAEWDDSRELIPITPEFEPTSGGRFIFITKNVHDELHALRPEQSAQARYARARQLLDGFVSNLRMVVRAPGSKSTKAQLAKLELYEEEVWAFRTQRPGVRVFGRFAEFDVFIALNIELRENIDDDFKREKEECKREWRKFFPHYNPHRGERSSEYLSNFYEV